MTIATGRTNSNDVGTPFVEGFIDMEDFFHYWMDLKVSPNILQ